MSGIIWSTGLYQTFDRKQEKRWLAQHHTSLSIVWDWAKTWAIGSVNFIPAVAYHLCLALQAAFVQPGTHPLAKPYTFNIVLTYKSHVYEGWCRMERDIEKEREECAPCFLAPSGPDRPTTNPCGLSRVILCNWWVVCRNVPPSLSLVPIYAQIADWESHVFMLLLLSAASKESSGKRRICAYARVVPLNNVPQIILFPVCLLNRFQGHNWGWVRDVVCFYFNISINQFIFRIHA